MNDEIEEELHALIGEPLSDMFRFTGIQAFEFGVQRPRKNRKGEDITLADLRVHVSCDWSLLGPEGCVVSSSDFGPGRDRRDERAKPFYDMLSTNPPIVDALEVYGRGSITLRMSNGYSLEVKVDEVLDTPQDTASEEGESGEGVNDDEDSDDLGDEQWRFIPKEEGNGHLVITSRGLYDIF